MGLNLKNFVMSGIKDVLDSRSNRGGQQPPSQPSNNNPGSNQYPSNSNSNNYDQNQGGNMYPGYGGGGYNPQTNNPQGGGYPPPQQGGYGGGYPPQNHGYPPQGGAPGYPQPGYPQGPAGYPGQAPPPIGFNAGGDAGYPPQPGYPPMGGQGGYPPMGGQSGYPPQNPGYPPQGGYPGQGYQPPPPQQQQYGQGYGAPQQGYQQQGGFPNQGFGAGPQMIGTPSVLPVPGFNANQDAETLRKAMKGLGCNNTKVIGVLCARTNFQRQEIARAFKVMYGKDLIKDLKSELSGDFEDLVLALMDPPAMYDAKQLHKAMDGIGTKESVLIEIMCSRTNAQIAELRNMYRMMYGKDLEKDLIGETSGCFKRLLISMCAGGRDEGYHVDPLRANQDARKLYSAGERRLGTDESTFNAVLASQNFNQLRAVFDEYQKVSNHSIEKAIESEFSGDIRDGFLAVIAIVRNRPAYFAKCLHDSMKGFGTRDTDLIRVVVTRAEYDMADIRNQFQGMYKTSLESMIKGDCSGSYKDGLIALVVGNAGGHH